jgi:integrase/recombinase XerD
MTDATDQLPTKITPAGRLLTTAEFHRLADVPPEVEWFANLTNPGTRRIYEVAVKDFMRFAGIVRAQEFRIVTRAHVIAWRDDLVRRGLGGSTIRNRLASLASLFEYLCEKNAVTHNPVKGVERPKSETGEGKTPALADHQARKLLLLDVLTDDTTRSKRDRAILSTLLFHALRRDELCKLKVRDFRHARKGVPHLKVSGKGGKTRYLPLHPGTHALIHEYLDAAGHGANDAGALLRPVRNNTTGRLDQAITPDGIYKLVRAYSAALGFEIGPHALRATAATNALTRPTSPRCRNGSATRTSRRPGFTIIAAPGARTARHSRSLTNRASGKQGALFFAFAKWTADELKGREKLWPLPQKQQG